MPITIILALFMFLSLFLPSLAAAAPLITNVTGTTTYTISGSSFGTKSTANPFTYDNFEDGTGDTTATIGTWENVQNFDITTASVRHVASTYNVGYNFKSNVTVGSWSLDSTVSEKWFVQYWFKLDSNWTWGTGTYGDGGFLSNIKMFRLSTVPRDVGGQQETPTVATYGWSNEMVYTTSDIANNGGGAFNSGYQEQFTKNVWHCLKFEYKESSLDTFDGILRIWLDGILILNASGFKTREDVNQFKHPELLGWYNSWETDSKSVLPDTFYLDEIYIDTTWSRVEIGNNSVYSSCTHREIQIPTAWSDTEITVTVNQGSFGNGESAYLFVIDSNGSASSGFPITVGESFNNSNVVTGNTTVLGNGVYQ
jgi:hypothetical protein